MEPEVPAFETAFADWLGVAHAVDTNSGTAALKVALKALGIGPGDEVITAPNSDIGTTAAIHHAGATAVWVDIEPDTGNIDPALAAAAVTPRTAAILIGVCSRESTAAFTAGPESPMRRSSRIMRIEIFAAWALALAVALGAGGKPAAAAAVTGYALVQQDGSLRISGRTVRLFGIYIPPTNRHCRTFIRPAKCAPRAVLELDFQLRGFARCERVRRNADASIDAVCRIKGTVACVGIVYLAGDSAERGRLSDGGRHQTASPGEPANTVPSARNERWLSVTP